MDIRKRLARLLARIRAKPLKYKLIIGGLGGLLVSLTVVFFFPKPIAFSFAAESSCVRHLSVFPQLLRQSGAGEFDLRPEGGFSIGPVKILSTKVCVSPSVAPKEGVYAASLAHFGLPLGKQFKVLVGEAPRANLAVLDAPVPVSIPLAIPLSTTDKIFEYTLRAKTKEADCQPHDKRIVCDTPDLQLKQGAKYTFTLERTFRGGNAVVVTNKQAKTLSATRAVKASIRSKSTVYSKPKSITIDFDKPLQSAEAKLFKVKGKDKQELPVTSTVKGKRLQMKLSGDLPRSSAYRLVIGKTNLQATDGSGLEKDYTLPFHTSGGPKVTGINIGATGVPLGTVAIVTFDQKLSKSQKLSGLVTLGGGASLIGKSGNTLRVSLSGVPKCSDFSIKLGSNIESSYGISGHSAWSFSGRTVCHSTSVIGYSSQGRAITAYTFGSGPAVVYTGAIHGSEASTNALMHQWIGTLEARARSIPAGRSVVVIPAINPDGLASGSRTNARNVDLNRNFATSDWRKDITDVNNRPFKGGGGSSAMSEPETKALAAYISRLRPRLVLSYHSIGGVVAANQAGISNTYAATYTRLSGYGNITGRSSETFEYSISGTADDWYAQKLGVASILVELGSHSYSQFAQNEAAMWAMLR